jgi:hypothetical protein
MSSYGKRVLIILCLGAIFPSIVVIVCWMATFGQMFNLLEGIVHPITQVMSVLFACTSLVGLCVVIHDEINWRR